MPTFDILAPKLGESILEVTITKWFVNVNDIVKEDDILFEVASDKVDSEIPSPVAGKITSINYPENTVVPIGKTVAVIDMSYDEDSVVTETEDTNKTPKVEKEIKLVKAKKETKEQLSKKTKIVSTKDRFYSPLVKNIAAKKKYIIRRIKSHRRQWQKWKSK